jgi:hypothetical protein
MRIILITILLFSSVAHSQVIIGDATGTATDKTSVLLEFANTGNKGVILPYVRTLPTTPTEGTILLDASTATASRVKYYNGSWVDLSGQNGNVTTSLTDQPITTENTTSKVIIGDAAATADGVLVLESNTKAMVLPIVTSVNNIPNPSPGMMVYINGAKKRLAVFNGDKWSFWKP